MRGAVGGVPGNAMILAGDTTKANAVSSERKSISAASGNFTILTGFLEESGDGERKGGSTMGALDMIETCSVCR